MQGMNPKCIPGNPRIPSRPHCRGCGAAPPPSPYVPEPPCPNVLLLAFDDTDSRDGGCTTHLAFHVLLAMPELALSGLPRLVRLNPNVPWKTRGNGAVVLPLGIPQGPQVRVGELRGREVLAFPEAARAEPTKELLQRVWKVLQANAQAGAQPAVALCADDVPAAAYWQAVRSRVLP